MDSWAISSALLLAGVISSAALDHFDTGELNFFWAVSLLALHRREASSPKLLHIAHGLFLRQHAKCCWSSPLKPQCERVSCCFACLHVTLRTRRRLNSSTPVRCFHKLRDAPIWDIYRCLSDRKQTRNKNKRKRLWFYSIWSVRQDTCAPKTGPVASQRESKKSWKITVVFSPKSRFAWL